MNKDPSDFMLEEYEQIAEAFFGLREQMNQWFRTYLSLMAIPLAIVGAVAQLNPSRQMPELTNLPPLVSVVLLAIAAVGFASVLAIVSVRAEAITYARTINYVRKYFAELSEQQAQISLRRFLVLPCTDQFPPFYEPFHTMFMIVIMAGLIDSLLVGVALVNVIPLPMWTIIPVVLCGIAIHWATYYGAAWRRDSEWTSGKAAIPAHTQAQQYASKASPAKQG